MDDHYIVTVYTVIDDILKACRVIEDCRAVQSTAEILTVGVIAAKYFKNHHERAVCVMSQLGYIGRLSISRFNRRLHAGYTVDDAARSQADHGRQIRRQSP